MSDFVLDASVSLAWFIPATNAQDQYVDNILTIINNGAVPVVPSMWVQEMASRLLKAKRSREISLATFNKAIKIIDDLPYETHHIAYNVPQLIELAKTYNLQGYDVVYFDLAKRLGIPMATVDRGIKTACRNYAVKLL